MINRRTLMTSGITIGLLSSASLAACSRSVASPEAKAEAPTRKKQTESDSMDNPDPATVPEYADWQLSEKEWKDRLTPEQYAVLRKEGTERPFTSPLNDEKRAGVFACAGCGLDLFSSETKYDSGTGWPSFYEPLPNALGTKTDFKLVLPRTEYHCARCGGHQGHVFKDGPAPTGLRYCNNGVALTFKPA